jgi:hypothetical protein
MSDRVFWSGAYKRPVVAPDKGEARTNMPGEIANRVAGTLKSKTDIVRIVVADSGELAYEYSRGILEFAVKSGEHLMRRLPTICDTARSHRSESFMSFRLLYLNACSST